MNNIPKHMPGFTAEAALYRTRERYRHIGSPDAQISRGEVHPQLCRIRGNTLCCLVPGLGWDCREIPWFWVE